MTLASGHLLVICQHFQRTSSLKILNHFHIGGQRNTVLTAYLSEIDFSAVLTSQIISTDSVKYPVLHIVILQKKI